MATLFQRTAEYVKFRDGFFNLISNTLDLYSEFLFMFTFLVFESVVIKRY